jgi:hypothetical protein
MNPKLFNEIVNRFYQNHLQDQIQTLQSGKISVGTARISVRSTNNEIVLNELIHLLGLMATNTYLNKKNKS